MVIGPIGPLLPTELLLINVFKKGTRSTNPCYHFPTLEPVQSVDFYPNGSNVNIIQIMFVCACMLVYCHSAHSHNVVKIPNW